MAAFEFGSSGFGSPCSANSPTPLLIEVKVKKCKNKYFQQFIQLPSFGGVQKRVEMTCANHCTLDVTCNGFFIQVRKSIFADHSAKI